MRNVYCMSTLHFINTLYSMIYLDQKRFGQKTLRAKKAPSKQLYLQIISSLKASEQKIICTRQHIYYKQVTEKNAKIVIYKQDGFPPECNLICIFVLDLTCYK